MLEFVHRPRLPLTHALWSEAVSEAPLPAFSRVAVTGTIARLTLLHYILINGIATQGFRTRQKDLLQDIKFLGQNLLKQFCIGDKCQISSHKG